MEFHGLGAYGKATQQAKYTLELTLYSHKSYISSFLPLSVCFFVPRVMY